MGEGARPACLAGLPRKRGLACECAIGGQPRCALPPKRRGWYSVDAVFASRGIRPILQLYFLHVLGMGQMPGPKGPCSLRNRRSTTCSTKSRSGTRGSRTGGNLAYPCWMLFAGSPQDYTSLVRVEP